MAERNGVYFVSDVHLGLASGDPAEREERFVGFLKSIPEDSRALYMLGDIWDFWYEYRDVVPRIGARVIAQLIRLADAGVEVYFMPGNHDIWCYSYFEELGIRKLNQPAFVEIDGKIFCLGHGDGLGGARRSYRLIQWIFHNRVLQCLFSTLHPWLAYRFGTGWSKSNREGHPAYRFRGKDEPLYKFAEGVLATREVDFFVFGHFHDLVDMEMPGGARFVVLRDWMQGGSPHAVFSGSSFELRF